MPKFNLNLTLAFLAIIPTFTPAPTITKIPGPQNTEVQNFRKTIQEKIQAKISESKSIPGTKIAWPGTIKEINALELKLDLSGQDKQITIDKAIVYSNSRKIDTAMLKPGQQILVMGLVKTETPDQMDARQIILNPGIFQNKIVRLVGTIGDISKSSKTIMVIPPSQKEIQVQITEKTELLSPNKTPLLYKDLFKDQRLIIFGQYKDKAEKIILPTKIYALSQKPGPTPSIAKPTQSK